MIETGAFEPSTRLPDGRDMATVAFEVAGGLSAASKVMSEVRLCTPAVSLGSVDTLIQHPGAHFATISLSVEAQVRDLESVRLFLVSLCTRLRLRLSLSCQTQQ